MHGIGMPHSLTLGNFAAAKWAHAQAKSWQRILEMRLDRELMAMSPNECPFGWPTPEVSDHSLESKAPIPMCGRNYILQSKEPGKETK